jgi:hypothetical protein
MGDLFIELMKCGWVGQTQISRINCHLNFLEGVGDGKFVAEFRSENIKVNGSSDKWKFVITFLFEEFCQCHLEVNGKCLCAEDRTKEQHEWDRLIEVVHTVKKVPS